MAKNDINYHSLANDGNPFIDKPNNGTPDDFTTDTENEEPNRDGIIIHVVPDTSKGKCPFCILLTCQCCCVSKCDSRAATAQSISVLYDNDDRGDARAYLRRKENKAVC